VEYRLILLEAKAPQLPSQVHDGTLNSTRREGLLTEDTVADIRAICAIGQRGQLGLNGRLPWEGNKGREYVADVARFFEATRGHVIIAGPRTIASMPAFAYEDRTICEIRSEKHPEEELAWFPDRVIFVGGGPPVWKAYAPFIRHWDITRLPYDGEADR
jgi:dihydromethanopterin reductase